MQKTAKEKVVEYLKDQIENHGLLRFNITRTDPFNPISKEKEEAFWEEVLRMFNASDKPDKEVLGKYSL